MGIFLSVLMLVFSIVAIHDNAYDLGGMLFIAYSLFFIGYQIERMADAHIKRDVTEQITDTFVDKYIDRLIKEDERKGGKINEKN